MKAIDSNLYRITENQLKAINRLSNELGPQAVLFVMWTHNWKLIPIENLSRGQAGIILRDLHARKEKINNG